MQHVLIKVNQDRDAIAQELFDPFKEHLRILHNNEDDMILMYLLASMDAITTYSDNDINETEYEVYYPQQLDYRSPSNLYGWYCGKGNIRNVKILDSNQGDITGDFKVDGERGMIYPHPPTQAGITFVTGYPDADIMPPRLVNIIFRLGAEYHENRESTRVGEPKMLPDWLAYSLASIWSPRV